jgi:hypothetical protein
MRYVPVALLLAAAGIAVFAGRAQAAAPQKSGTLIGTIKASPFDMTVTVNVSQSGTISSLSYLCGTGRAPVKAYNIPVDSTGHFAYESKLKDWKLLGHFVTPTTAFVSMNSIACGGAKGSTTLHVKTNNSAPSAATASGVKPQPNSTLTGTIMASPFAMTVTINVSSGGSISSFSYLCGTGRAPTNVFGIPVDSTGHFAYESKLKDWKVLGHFVSPTTAFVSMNSVACGGGKGSTTLHVKT